MKISILLLGLLYGSISAKYVEKKVLCSEPNSFIAIVWPIAHGKHAAILRVLNMYGRVVHYEEKVLSPKLAYIILKKSHYNAPESVTRDFKAHLRWYFPRKELFLKPARIFVCTFENTQRATECKYAVRKLFNLGYRAIHINDTYAETLELADLVLAKQA